MRHVPTLITMVLLIDLAGSGSLVAGADKTKPRITISRETSWLLEPVGPDGYIDYVAAINKTQSAGITADNNAAVLLAKVLGPSTIPEALRKPYFEALGIAELPEDDSYFVPLEHTPPIQIAVGPDFKLPDVDPKIAAIDTQLRRARERPWTTEECPIVARWLEQNEALLATVIEASQRPRYFEPMLVPTGFEDESILTLATSYLPIEQVTDALVCRAMRSLAADELTKAAGDILAVHRLARLVAQGCDPSQTLRGYRMEAFAFECNQHLVQHPRLTQLQLRSHTQQSSALLPYQESRQYADFWERIVFLQSMSAIAREAKLEGKPVDLDWDEILRIGNQFFDRHVAGNSKETRQELRRELDEMTREAEKNFQRAQRIENAKDLAAVVLRNLMPGGLMDRAHTRISVRMKLTHLGFVLLDRFHRTGSFPASLTPVPEHVNPNLIVDPATNEPFRLITTSRGIRLYGVGENGLDEEGRSFHDEPQGDDIRFELVKVRRQFPPFEDEEELEPTAPVIVASQPTTPPISQTTEPSLPHHNGSRRKFLILIVAIVALAGAVAAGLAYFSMRQK